MSYISVYIENSAKPDAGFLNHKSITTEEYQNLVKAFIEAGGLTNKEEVAGNQRVIISSWKDVDSYTKWITHELSQPYLKKRDHHNLINNIKSTLIITEI